MKQHPAAWIPSQIAARDMRQLARELRVELPDGEVRKLPDGSQSISSRAEGSAYDATYDIRVDRTLQTVTLPPLYVDFWDWFYLPAQSLSGLPLSGTYWIRLKTGAVTTAGNQIGSEYVNVTVTIDPVYEWRLESAGLPATEAGGAGEVLYYWYVAKFTDGALVSSMPRTRNLIVGLPQVTP